MPPTPSEAPKLGTAISRALKILLAPEHQGRPCGLLCVRVDGSDAVQALLGSRGVKSLLAEASERLNHCIRDTDTAAFSQGNIFFIVAGGLEWEDDLALMAERIQRTCSQPYLIDGEEVRSGLTIGGAGCSTAEHDAAKLAQQALLAMHRAASRGIPFELYVDPTAKPEVSADPALAPSDPFELTFHPQFTAERKLAGAKVCVRMSARGRARRPTAVARAAHEKGTDRIADRILRKLLNLRRSWIAQGFAVPTLSIEVEANHLLSTYFADSFRAMLAETGAEASAVELLMTEATALTRLGAPQPTLAVLAKAGVRLGLTGFSLHEGTRLDLRKLPFSSLHISCQSVFRATSDRESLWLARSIAGVAHRSGLMVIAEDIESESQRAILLESGCDRFEGPLLSPALGASGLGKLLYPPPP